MLVGVGAGGGGVVAVGDGLGVSVGSVRSVGVAVGDVRPALWVAVGVEVAMNNGVNGVHESVERPDR